MSPSSARSPSYCFRFGAIEARHGFIHISTENPRSPGCALPPDAFFPWKVEISAAPVPRGRRTLPTFPEFSLTFLVLPSDVEFDLLYQETRRLSTRSSLRDYRYNQLRQCPYFSKNATHFTRKKTLKSWANVGATTISNWQIDNSQKRFKPNYTKVTPSYRFEFRYCEKMKESRPSANQHQRFRLPSFSRRSLLFHQISVQKPNKTLVNKLLNYFTIEKYNYSIKIYEQSRELALTWKKFHTYRPMLN